MALRFIFYFILFASKFTGILPIYPAQLKISRILLIIWSGFLLIVHLGDSIAITFSGLRNALNQYGTAVLLTKEFYYITAVFLTIVQNCILQIFLICRREEFFNILNIIDEFYTKLEKYMKFDDNGQKSLERHLKKVWITLSLITGMLTVMFIVLFSIDIFVNIESFASLPDILARLDWLTSLEVLLQYLEEIAETERASA